MNNFCPAAAGSNTPGIDTGSIPPKRKTSKQNSLANNQPDSKPAAPHESVWRTAWTKAIFLGLCWTSFFIFTAIGVLAYYLIHPRLSEFQNWIILSVQISIVVFYFILGGGLFLISATAMTGLDLLYPHGGHPFTVKVLFPIAAAIGRLAGFSRSSLRTSFVKVNNALTKAQRKRIKGDRLMILLPHCLQIDICNRKITSDINNCVRCGRCPVGELVKMGEKYGLRIDVVNGGTVARSRTASFKPDSIVAVACERDLTLGIQDVYPIPVYGVINDRPNGPCHNTCVDMKLVEEAVQFFKK